MMHKRLACLLVAVLCAGASPLRAEGPSVDAVVLRPIDEAEVPAERGGVLLRLLVEEGDRVVEGQVIAELDAREAELAVRRAEIEYERAAADAANRVRVEYAEKASEVAKAELRRSGESIEQFAKSISESQLDVERLTVEKLALEKQEAEHQIGMLRFDARLKESELDAARLALEQRRVRAPFAGRVVLVRARRGEWIEAGTPVVRLVGTDVLRAEGFLAAGSAEPGLVGLRAEFTPTLLGPGGKTRGPFVGRLAFVSPEIDPVTRQVRVWAEVENTEGKLRPGEQGGMTLVPEPGADGGGQ